METVLLLVYNFFKKHRALFWCFFISIFLLISYFALQIKFEEDISKVLPKDKQVEKLTEIFQNSKFADRLVVMVSLKDTGTIEPDRLVEFADSFVVKANETLSPFIDTINDKIDDAVITELFGTISNHLPIYLSEQDYSIIDSLITPEKVGQTLSENIRTLSSPAGIALKSIIIKDPVGISFLGLKKLQQLQYDDNFELYDNYVITKDYKTLLLFISPRYPPNNTGKNAQLLSGLDSIFNTAQQTNFKNIEAAYFGATAVSVGNSLQLRKDTLYTQGTTLLFIIIFLAVYFRRTTAPLIILVPVLFGTVFSLTAIYFIKGSISVIALGTGSVVLGIAVNYSLHVFNHYKHTRNMQIVIKDLAIPLTVGGFTTIGGFLCLQFVKSDLLKELGLFAAFSLIGASLCSLFFLPHLISTKKTESSFNQLPISWIDRVASFRPEFNKYIIVIIIALTFVFAYTARNVSFESDMLHMSFLSDKLKKSETQLNKINVAALQSVYLVTEGTTLHDALVNNEKLDATIEQLKEKQIVKKQSGVSSLIISDSLQQIRIERWKAYWTPEKKQLLLTTLQKEGKPLGYKENAFERFTALLNTDFKVTDATEMAALRKSFLSDFITEKKEHVTVVTLLKVSPENKQTIYNAFAGNKNVTVIDKQFLTSRLVDIVISDFTSIALMTSLLVFLVLLLTYGRIELALVSFIPMFISWIWILGIMGLFGIQFNIINIIISTLIFGLGDDYSLFIMDGLVQEYKTGKKNLSSYKSSIFLSAITTIAGLGVLVFAKHPALQSIAIISIIGILSVVLISQILIPFLFRLLIINRTDKKLFPWTLVSFIRSVFAFAFFVVGSLGLTILGVILIKLNPFFKEKSKYIYHVCLSKFAWLLTYTMSNVKKQVINPLNEDFSTPAVVVCNHLSSLDILLTVMLHPKLILLTNKWVWNSPVFGFVVRMADYYPVTEGAETSIELMAEKVKNGYSIVVFPEGTRSIDGNMKRFHKGAFFLAEKLNIDILPIVIHGSAYTAKDDFMLKDGKVTVKFLPRVKPTDIKYGTNYSERTKGISRNFKEEYKALKAEVETPVFYKQKLIYNYLYKGPVLEWYMRVKLRLEKYYNPIYELLPKEGKLLDIGCGYGFMAYMLHFASPELDVTGIDYDEEKIELANHCFNKDETINFFYADVMTFSFEKYDAIIVADMLHYLQPDQQKEIIKKCFDSLTPEGVLVIRDGNKDLAERHKGTKLTEFFSTKVVSFNKTTNNGLSFLSGSLIKDLAKEHKMECSEIDNSTFTSNMLFVIKNKSVINE